MYWLIAPTFPSSLASFRPQLRVRAGKASYRPQNLGLGQAVRSLSHYVSPTSFSQHFIGWPGNVTLGGYNFESWTLLCSGDTGDSGLDKVCEDDDLWRF
jgi:hypothetical protein